MFRIIAIIGFAVVLVGMTLHYLALRARKGDWAAPRLMPDHMGIFRKLIYLVTLVCLIILTVTGFGAALISGKPLGGYGLMLHCAAAPIFSVGLVLWAVLGADRCRFNKDDWPRRNIKQEHDSREAITGTSLALAQKMCFWLIVVIALPVISSMVLGMFPLFGSEGQEMLYRLHQYSTLILVMAALVYIYLLMLACNRKD